MVLESRISGTCMHHQIKAEAEAVYCDVFSACTHVCARVVEAIAPERQGERGWGGEGGGYNLQLYSTYGMISWSSEGVSCVTLSTS